MPVLGLGSHVWFMQGMRCGLVEVYLHDAGIG